MDIILDARVIQDHFPGIARYAYNLLLALPAHLRRGESLYALRDTTLANSHYDWVPLVRQHVQFLNDSVKVFGPANLVRRPPLPLHYISNSIFHFPYYVRPYRLRRPSITTIHDIISLIYPQLVPSATARISIRLFNALAIRASDVVITVSRSAAADLTRYFPSARGKTVVVHEAPDLGFRPQPGEQIEDVRVKHNLPAHYALFLASNKPHKNLVRLVDAWKIVIGDWRPEFGDPPVLVIAGHQDPRYPDAETRAKDLGLTSCIQFLGDSPNAELPALYSGCDLFVFPSLYEGFGLPPLEAMACGAPVACSNASSLPEVVGDAALLFDPTRPHEIAATILRVLSDQALQSELRQRSLRQAARFTWDDAARNTMDIYHDVMRSSQSKPGTKR